MTALRKRVVASTTWDVCCQNRPHLAEILIFEGAERDLEGIMRHPSLWKAREFICRFCAAHTRLRPTAIIIENSGVSGVGGVSGVSGVSLLKRS